MRCKLVIIAITPLWLLGCARSGGDHSLPAATPPSTAATTANVVPPPAAGMQRFDSQAYAFRIDYPAAMKVSHDFERRYMEAGSWKVYASPGSAGTPVLALILPGSNDVTAAELRIGVSQAPAEIQQCESPPNAMRTTSRGHASIGGTEFASFRVGDAAMSHYLSAHSYRVVHEHRCYAIDLLVMGTRPEVYDPPKTPPFSQEQAFTQLQQVLQGFHFTD